MHNTGVPWIMRLKEGAWAPIWLGLSVALGYLLILCLFDGFFLITWGFPPGTSPWLQTDIWWPELINATLIGYVPAVLLIASRGIDRDLSQLRPWLPSSDAEVNEIRTAATGPAGAHRAGIQAHRSCWCRPGGLHGTNALREMLNNQ